MGRIVLGVAVGNALAGVAGAVLGEVDAVSSDASADIVLVGLAVTAAVAALAQDTA